MPPGETEAEPGVTTIEVKVTGAGVVPPEALLGGLPVLLVPLPPPHALSSIREIKIRHNDNDEVFTLSPAGEISRFFPKFLWEGIRDF